MRRAALTAAVCAVLAAACGGGGTTATESPSATVPPTTPPTTVPPSSPSGPECVPEGAELELSSSPATLAFDRDCLAAPAGEEVTVAFDNRSPSVPHNVSVATDGLVDILFEGDIVTGPKEVTYSVPPLEAGTYVFYCKVHPTQMNGTYVVA